MVTETTGRSRLQRTKPGLDYRVAVVGARPPPSSGVCSSCCMPNSTVSPARHGTLRFTVVPAAGFVKAQGGNHSPHPRPATCDFKPRAAGGGRLQASVRSPHRSRKTMPEPEGTGPKEGTSAAGSVWISSGLGHARVNSAGSTGSAVGPLPLPGSPSPTGMGSAGTTPVPSQSRQRLANLTVDVGLRVCTNQRSGRRSRAHTSRECLNLKDPPRTCGPEALTTQKYTMPS